MRYYKHVNFILCAITYRVDIMESEESAYAFE